MLILKLILLLCLVAVLVSNWVAVVRILRAYNKRRLLADANSVTCDAQDCAGISALCSGVYDMEQIENLLDVEYSRYEVVLVVDSERNGELFHSVLSRYQMSAVNYAVSFELPSIGVRVLYRSRKRCYRRLLVLDKAQTTVMDDFDAAAGVASFDYLLPVHADRWLLPKAIERLVVEVSERPHTVLRLVRSLMGEPAMLISRDSVVDAGGFGKDMLGELKRKDTKTLYEPLMYSCKHAGCCMSAYIGFVVLFVLSAVGVWAAFMRIWPLAAVMSTLVALWCMVRYVAPVVAPFEAYSVNCIVAMKYFLRRMAPKNFMMS